MMYQKTKQGLICIILSLLMIGCINACLITNVYADTIEGGWEIDNPEAAVTLPADVKTAYENATADLAGVSYTPIAYYASQVVSGTNYAILCYKTTVTNPPTSTLALVKISSDLNGKSSILSVDDFNIGDYAKDYDVVPGTPASGSWTVPADYTKSASVPKAASFAFDTAVKGLAGSKLEIMAYLGSQVVSGTNYAYLCHSQSVTLNPIESIRVIIINEDLKGEAKILSSYTLIPEKIVQETPVTPEKAENSAKAAKTSVKKTFTQKSLKKKARTVALPKVTTKYGTAKWKVTKKDKKKVLSLSGKKIKVKKGAKKGTYTIKVKATVAATTKYKAASTKVVTVKVMVKK